MENSMSQAGRNLFQKTTHAYQYQLNPYLKIDNLFKFHKDLIEQDDYEKGNKWIDHLEHDLMKFWMKPSVQGMEHGLFRTFFTNEGLPLPGLDESESWPRSFQKAIQKDEEGNYTEEAGSLLEGEEKSADKNYVRAHSRQTFAYGIAYHMTGNTKYFELCRKGAYAMLDLIDDEGSMLTRQRLNGDWIHDVKTRTSQDLAYGMTGIGFYYYLTHDEKVLKKILLLKNYIFKNYYHKGKDLFTWLPYKNHSPQQSIELVSHLDQLYAYMLWLTPSLPQPYKDEFKADMQKIVDIMIERFYTEVYGTFWGSSNSPDMKVLGTDHTDFGHSVKSMWVIFQVGVWTNNITYMNFARPKIHAILENAFDEGNGSWNRRILQDGSIDKDKEWWSLAELDQAAAILALKDPTYLQYLNKTYAFWFKNMVDNKNGEVWHILDGETLMPKKTFPKAHCWKTSLHTFEHALIGYLTSKQLLSETFDLYYAFESLDDVKYQTVTPYIFKSNITKTEAVKVNGEEELINDGDVDRLNIRVTFDSLH